MFLTHAHRKKHFKKTTQLSIVRLVTAIGFAGIDTIWSLYMNSFGLTDSSIGFISAGLVIISLLAAFYSTPVLEKIHEVKVLGATLLLTVIAYFLIAFSDSLYVFLALAIILTIIGVLRFESFDILFRDESKKKDLNENEGLMYALMNVGWLLGPLVAGFILLKFNISAVFISSALFVLIGLFIFLNNGFKNKEKTKDVIDGNILENIKDFIKNKKLRIPYLIAGGVEIWWALIYVYMPLFIINNGLGEDIVGLFLAAIIIPLVLFEYKIGKLSERLGFRLFFSLGFLLLALVSFISFMTSSIYLILFILVLSSFAMALIEPLQDSFFFRQIPSSKEEKFYPTYSTATDLGSFVGKFSIAGFLLFLPQNYSYLIIGVFMALIGIVCLKIKE